VQGKRGGFSAAPGGVARGHVKRVKKNPGAGSDRCAQKKKKEA